MVEAFTHKNIFGLIVPLDLAQDKKKYSIDPVVWQLILGVVRGTLSLIEMLGEFFLIYDEGRRCKVIYDENIFPHI
jgi:hypothetical protein